MSAQMVVKWLWVLKNDEKAASDQVYGAQVDVNHFIFLFVSFFFLIFTSQFQINMNSYHCPHGMIPYYFGEIES